MHPLTGTRPRIEGDREDEILDATLNLLLEVGYDRLTLDAVARRARGQQGDALPPLGQQAQPGRRRHGAREAGAAGRGPRHRVAARRPGAAPSAGPTAWPGDATGMLGSVITALCSDPEFAAKFREEFIAPKIAVSRGDLRPRRRARRDRRRRRPRDHRPRARRDPAPPRLRAGPRARRRHRPRASSTTSSCRPSATRPADATPPRTRHPEPREESHDAMTDTTAGRGSEPTDGVDQRPAPPPRLGARAHLHRPADGGARRHHREHRAALHPERPRTSPPPTCAGS